MQNYTTIIGIIELRLTAKGRLRNDAEEICATYISEINGSNGLQPLYYHFFKSLQIPSL